MEAAEYLESLGASEGGLASLIRTAYRQLGLLTYFTTGRHALHSSSMGTFEERATSPHKATGSRLLWGGGTQVQVTALNWQSFLNISCHNVFAGVPETRAWTIRKGMTAPEAAGVIHSDFERGFIKAETVGYDDLVSAGSLGQAKENGRLRLEGKEYVVNEGDVMNFKFNV